MTEEEVDKEDEEEDKGPLDSSSESDKPTRQSSAFAIDCETRYVSEAEVVAEVEEAEKEEVEGAVANALTVFRGKEAPFVARFSGAAAERSTRSMLPDCSLSLTADLTQSAIIGSGILYKGLDSSRYQFV